MFPDASGSGHVYIHNFTRAITKTQPSNLSLEVTDVEKSRLGVFIMDLPGTLKHVYDSKKLVPLVYGSSSVCEMLTKYSAFAEEQHLLDATKLRRLNHKVLEDSRKAIVNAMRYGKTLCIYVGDDVCDFVEKVCVRKNSGSIPLDLFEHGGLGQPATKEAIFRDEDRESGMCVVRPGFRVYLLATYAREGALEMTTTQEADMAARIPRFAAMHVVRCYCEYDRVTLLQNMQRN